MSQKGRGKESLHLGLDFTMANCEFGGTVTKINPRAAVGCKQGIWVRKLYSRSPHGFGEKTRGSVSSSGAGRPLRKRQRLAGRVFATPQRRAYVFCLLACWMLAQSVKSIFTQCVPALPPQRSTKALAQHGVEII